MKMVMVLFDSLNRNMLGAYNDQAAMPTPNFDRLAKKCVRYNQHYVGSMPCMPARRDMLTGRHSFLHRSWGPIEPFDNTFTEALQTKGVYTHLVTDHYHYWEDGGLTYHNRYNSYEFIRGQEGDSWKAIVEPDWEALQKKYHKNQFGTEPNRNLRGKNFSTDMINRLFIKEEEDFPGVQTFKKGIEFLENNKQADNWFLQIETFDPHEPFFAPEKFRYAKDKVSDGPIYDWPQYGKPDHTKEEDEELRANYRAIVAMCDSLLGQVLDLFDENDMWDDTALMVTTDHGFLLGEHDFWGKGRMNIYQEIAHIPMFLYRPENKNTEPQPVDRITQNIDIAPTVLNLFGVNIPKEVQGKCLFDSDKSTEVKREGAIFGFFGGAVHLTTGKYTYHRYPLDVGNVLAYQYTLMPTHLSEFFSVKELSKMEVAGPFEFTKGARVMKIPMDTESPIYNKYGPGGLIESGTRLYDIEADPLQKQPIDNRALEKQLSELMVKLMTSEDAPIEAYERLGLSEET